jgi:hypothetical protein
MSDSKRNHSQTPIDGEEAAQPQKDTADLKRRGAVRYLALGLGLAAAGFLVPGRAHAAYGKCTVSGCYCCGYGGQGNLCSNCGHQYSDHGGGTC